MKKYLLSFLLLLLSCSSFAYSIDIVTKNGEKVYKDVNFFRVENLYPAQGIIIGISYNDDKGKTNIVVETIPYKDFGSIVILK